MWIISDVLVSILVSGCIVGQVTGDLDPGDQQTELAEVKAELKELQQAFKHVLASRGRRSVTPEWTHCPNGFMRNDYSCYHVSHLLASWPDALVYCEAYGADLVAIETESEQKFISSYLHTIAASITDPRHYFWVGGTDAVVEGQWIWAKSARPVTDFTAWSPGNPNNEPSHTSHSQDCMAVYGNNNYSAAWDDGYCEIQHNFICEIELTEGSEIVG